MSHVQALHQADETADRIRGELLKTLDELDRRRQSAMDFRHQAERNWRVLAIAGGALTALLALRVGFGQWSKARAQRQLMHRRRESLLRAWNHPDRVAVR